MTNVISLAAQVTSELIEVGEFTYYDDEGWRGLFETTNVLHQEQHRDRQRRPDRPRSSDHTHITIGDGASIAAHNVVTKHVDPCAVVGGNPAG